MQHLLDFIQEHTLEEQLYFVAPCAIGELEVLWRRADSMHDWQLRRRPEGTPRRVHRSELIRELELCGADMASVKRELTAMLGAQIAFADMLLRDAGRELGRDVVQRFVVSHQTFIHDLQVAIEKLTTRAKPRMVLVPGGGAQTSTREGHLSIVR